MSHHILAWPQLQLSWEIQGILKVIVLSNWRAYVCSIYLPHFQVCYCLVKSVLLFKLKSSINDWLFEQALYNLIRWMQGLYFWTDDCWFTYCDRWTENFIFLEFMNISSCRDCMWLYSSKWFVCVIVSRIPFLASCYCKCFYFKMTQK